MTMLSKFLRKYRRLRASEQLSLTILIFVMILNMSTSVMTYFELPGVATYGLWIAQWVDEEERNHITPAFFSNEPWEYHILHFIIWLSWGSLGFSVWMFLSDKPFMRLPKFLRQNRQHAVAFFCFLSALLLNSGIYYFYSIVDSFAINKTVSPEIRTGTKVAGLACFLQVISALILVL